MSDADVSIGFSSSGDAVIATVSKLDSALLKLGTTAGLLSTRIAAVATSLDRMGDRGAQSVDKFVGAQARQIDAMDKARASTNNLAASLRNLDNDASKTSTGLRGVTVRTVEVSDAAKRVERSTREAGDGFAAMVKKGAQIAGITLTLAAIGNEMKTIITTTADFGEAMAGIAAVGGLQRGTQQFEELSDAAKDVGATTRFTATEAALGLRELVAAGMSAEDSMASLKDVVDLSVAGQMNMARASEITVAAMSSWKLEASESARVGNVLARAANASLAGVDDLGEALKFVAPVAAAVNAPIEDVGAALSVLAQNGVKGGMAGRGLVSVFSRMIAPTKDVLDILASLGVEADSINPSIVGLEGAFKKLSQFDQRTLVKMFGAENLDISNVLARNTDMFVEFQGMMRDTSVTAAGMAATMNDSLKGSFVELSSAIDATRQTMGEVFEGDFEQTVREVTSWIRENEEGFRDLARTVKEIGPPLLKIVAAYVAIRAGISGVQTALSVGKWIKETAAIVANTAAMIANAKARNLYAEVSLSQALGRNTGKLLTTNVATLFTGAFGSSAVKGGVLRGVAALGTIAAAAVAGWALGTAIEKAFDISGKVSNAVNGELEGIQGEANRALANAASMVENAKDEKSLAEAKKNIQADINNWQQKALSLSGREREEALQTVELLKLRLSAAERINNEIITGTQLEQEKANAEKQRIRDIENAQKEQERSARQRYENEKRVGDTIERNNSLMQSLFSAKTPEAELINVERESGKVVALANYYRRVLSSMAQDKGVALVGADKEMKTVQDVLQFYVSSAKAIAASGDVDLVGSSQLNYLAKLAQGSDMLAKRQQRAEEQKRQREEEDQRRAESRRDIMNEIAIAEAKAAGNETKARRLEREQKILSETKRIMDGMDVSESKARALAIRKVNAEGLAEQRKKDGAVDGRAEVVASSLAEIGGGGRVYGIGMQSMQERALGAAERQVDLLSKVAAILEMINERGIRGGKTGGLQIDIL